MQICSNTRCGKVIDYEGKGISFNSLCPVCEAKSADKGNFTSIYCGQCGMIHIVRPKLIGERSEEISNCQRCSAELKKRQKESY